MSQSIKWTVKHLNFKLIVDFDLDFFFSFQGAPCRFGEEIQIQIYNINKVIIQFDEYLSITE